jgi:hypothetical protein
MHLTCSRTLSLGRVPECTVSMWGISLRLGCARKACESWAEPRVAELQACPCPAFFPKRTPGERGNWCPSPLKLPRSSRFDRQQHLRQRRKVEDITQQLRIPKSSRRPPALAKLTACTSMRLAKPNEPSVLGLFILDLGTTHELDRVVENILPVHQRRTVEPLYKNPASKNTWLIRIDSWVPFFF